MKKDKKEFTKNSIGEVLNNAVIMSGNPSSLKKTLLQSDTTRLQTMTLDMMAPYKELIKEGIIQPEEAVFALTVSAFLIQAIDVLKTNKLPAFDTIKPLLNNKIEYKLANVVVKCPHCNKDFNFE